MFEAVDLDRNGQVRQRHGAAIIAQVRLHQFGTEVDETRAMRVNHVVAAGVADRINGSATEGAVEADHQLAERANFRGRLASQTEPGDGSVVVHLQRPQQGVVLARPLQVAGEDVLVSDRQVQHPAPDHNRLAFVGVVFRPVGVGLELGARQSGGERVLGRDGGHKELVGRVRLNARRTRDDARKTALSEHLRFGSVTIGTG